MIKTRLIILVYRTPEPSPFWKLHNLHLSYFTLSAYDGINCLTQKTANKLTSFLGSKKEIEYIPWCTDEKFFLGQNNTYSKYFFSSGKTNRDYETLLNAIVNLPNKQFLLIGHFTKMNLTNQLSNLSVIHSGKKQTDTAIPYNILIKYYSQAIAVCISLKGDPNDTCGYTELLEAMSMGKPVLMTRSGCLDIDIEKENIGYYIKPNDPIDWINKINLISNSEQEAKKMGENGRRLIEKTYNISSYEKRIKDFLLKVTCL